MSSRTTKSLIVFLRGLPDEGVSGDCVPSGFGTSPHVTRGSGLLSLLFFSCCEMRDIGDCVGVDDWSTISWRSGGPVDCPGEGCRGGDVDLDVKGVRVPIP